MQSEELLHPPYNWSRHEDWTLWVTSSLHHGQSLALLLADLSNQIARQADTDCVTTLAALQLHLETKVGNCWLWMDGWMFTLVHGR